MFDLREEDGDADIRKICVERQIFLIYFFKLSVLLEIYQFYEKTV